MATKEDVRNRIIDANENTRKGFNKRMYDDGENFRLYPGGEEDADGEDLAEDLLLLNEQDQEWVIDETQGHASAVGGKRPC